MFPTLRPEIVAKSKRGLRPIYVPAEPLNDGGLVAQSSPGIPVRSPRRLTPIDSLPDERGDTSRSRESRPQSALEASAENSLRIPSVQSPPPLYFQAALPYHILAPHPNDGTNCDRE